MNRASERLFQSFLPAKTKIFFVLLCVGYCVLLWAFSTLDLYHSGFDAQGPKVAFYNGLRLGFVFYLFWVLYSTGDLLLVFAGGATYRSGPVLDRLVLGFFAGVGVWQIVLFALGLANMLHQDLLIALTLSMIVASWPTFKTLVTGNGLSESNLLSKVRKWRQAAGPTLLIMLLTSAGLLAAVKGLYPAGGHDYYTHYFHYYREVVESGSIWPNNVYYHFYYSKGAGLFFLAMLLTDPLAPQLVTLCMFAGGALSIMAFVSHLGMTQKWQAVFVTLLFAAFIYTPGPRENMLHGGWGDFEKLHEFQAMLAFFLIYAFCRLMSRDVGGSEFRISAMLAVAAAVIITPPTAAFYVLAGFLVFLIALSRGMKDAAMGIASILFTAVVTVASIMALNYLVTGFPSDQGMKLFWTFADFEKIQHWGVLPNFIIAHEGLTGPGANESPVFSLKTLSFLASSFRLDLFAVAILSSALWFFWRVTRLKVADAGTRKRMAAMTVLLCFFVVGCVVALAFGRTQSISFYRFSSFLIPVTLFSAATFWVAPTPRPVGGAGTRLVAALPAVMILLTVLVVCGIFYDRSKARDIVRNAVAFIAGKHSIGSAYTSQIAWPGRLPWGGIYPAARIAQGLVPIGERLWSLNIHAYCMAPNCRIESYQSYRLNADWVAVLFENPHQARSALQAAGLNYFLISTELSIPDPLALSSLFRPASVGRYFGVIWTDGKTALLTWKDAKSLELPADWIEAYGEQISKSRLQESFPFGPLERVLRDVATHGDYNRIRTLRWDQGLDGMLAPSVNPSP